MSTPLSSARAAQEEQDKRCTTCSRESTDVDGASLFVADVKTDQLQHLIGLRISTQWRRICQRRACHIERRLYGLYLHIIKIVHCHIQLLHALLGQALS